MILLFVESVLFDRFVGRWHGDARLSDGEQVTGRRQLRLQEERTADHHQGEAAGDPEDGVLADAQADEAYPRAARQGNGAAHEGHPGKHLTLLKWRVSTISGRILTPSVWFLRLVHVDETDSYPLAKACFVLKNKRTN